MELHKSTSNLVLIVTVEDGLIGRLIVLRIGPALAWRQQEESQAVASEPNRPESAMAHGRRKTRCPSRFAEPKKEKETRVNPKIRFSEEVQEFG